MKFLHAVLLALSLLLSLHHSTAIAGYDEGIAAYIKNDYLTALREFEPLAAQGNASAQFMLGLMYDSGTYVRKNVTEAVKWYRLAADQGEAIAQRKLGEMYLESYDVPHDYKEAVKYLSLAAEQGEVKAQIKLGEMYNKGQGVAKNKVEAVKWYQLAADQGNDNAKSAIANVEAAFRILYLIPSGIVLAILMAFFIRKRNQVLANHKNSTVDTTRNIGSHPKQSSSTSIKNSAVPVEKKKMSMALKVSLFLLIGIVFLFLVAAKDAYYTMQKARIAAKELQVVQLEEERIAESTRIEKAKRKTEAKRVEEVKRKAEEDRLMAVPSLNLHETTNRIGITMVDIPEGNFLMGSCRIRSAGEINYIAEQNKKREFLGKALIATTTNCQSNASDADRADEGPQHLVSIRKFQMGKTEVTLGQFKQFITAVANDARQRFFITAVSDTSELLENTEKRDLFMKYNNNGDNAAVVLVSWDTAKDFIAWLNRTDGGGWRLPSEAEWEYACRAGGNHIYCGSNNLESVAWYKENSGGHAQAVGQKKPNAFGLYDMSGNALEWVEDIPYDYDFATTDGSACTFDRACTENNRLLGHMQRGGGWSSSSSGPISGVFRSKNRSNYGVNLDTGFRLARTR